MNDSLVDKIAQSCIDCYKKLPKTGKPVDQEWTVLSCIVQYESDQEKCEVVSLGTGSRCIGASKMSHSGNVLNDSHAEVIARRGFLVYIYVNMDNAMNNRPSIFTFEDGAFQLKPGIEFIFYSSQLPCGDASIIPMSTEDEYGDVLQTNKRPARSDLYDVDHKRSRLEKVGDIYRTGARCLPAANQDPKEPGANYHALGQVRTKPGRGDETLSVSCSDKLARWIHVGIQGALLDMLLGEPIYIKYFIFGAGVPYSSQVLERAFINRNGNSIALDIVPMFYQSSITFPYKRNETNNRPAATSIVWIKTDNENGIYEATTQGVKLGLIKKRYNLVSAYLCISKYKLYQRFLRLLIYNPDLKFNIDGICGHTKLEDIPYNEMKIKSDRYLKKWAEVKKNFFKMWTRKPDMWNFCVNNT